MLDPKLTKNKVVQPADTKSKDDKSVRCPKCGDVIGERRSGKVKKCWPCRCERRSN